MKLLKSNNSRFIIKKKKTPDEIKTWQWAIFDTKENKWLTVCSNYKELKKTCFNLNQTEPAQNKPNLSCIVSNRLTWSDLALKRINKAQGKHVRKENKAGLKLIKTY